MIRKITRPKSPKTINPNTIDRTTPGSVCFLATGIVDSCIAGGSAAVV